jgi:hypothetical protein
LKAEFSPRGRAEEEAVLDLALLHWEKQTVWRLRLTTVLRDPFTHDILQTEGKSWVGIRKGLRAAARDERTLQGRAEANFSELHTHLQRLQEEICNAGKEEIKMLDQKLATCLRILNEYAVPLLQKLMQGPNPEQAFDRAYVPESLDKIVRLEAALDARIAKVLARLVGLKEFKRTPAAGTAQVLAAPPRS